MANPKTRDEAIRRIMEGFARNKGKWVVTVHDGNALLAVGSTKVVKATGGTIVALRLTREELLNLRRAADEALSELDAQSPPH